MSSFGSVPSFGSGNDDDVFDRLSHRWTAGTLAVFAVLVTTKTYVREDPISCWVPKEFSSSWEDYVNSYCWVQNTYYIPWKNDIPMDPAQRSRNPIIYYQWVPLILMVQAVLFYIPAAIWRGLNSKGGIALRDIVISAERFCYGEDLESKNRALLQTTRQLHRSLGGTGQPHSRRHCCGEGLCDYNCLCVPTHRCCDRLFSKRYGKCLVILYMTVKLLFLGNAVGQLFLLNWFLGHQYSMYGVTILRAMIADDKWEESPIFPYVTLCDFRIRRLANVHRYTVQCVLPINLFNEKIYLYLWFWFLLVSCFTLLGFLVWLVPLASRWCRHLALMGYLSGNEEFESHKPCDKRTLDLFLDEYLGSDGYLMMRLLDVNTNQIVVREVVGSLWKQYLDISETKQFLTDASEESVNHIV